MGSVLIELHALNSCVAALAKDGNLDVEDLLQVLGRAELFSPLTTAEKMVLSETLRDHKDSLEPAATQLLEDLLADKEVLPLNRVLLAPHPRGAQRDLYYARQEVSSLQLALSGLGILTVVDGDYGPGTTASVQQFQQGAGLKQSGLVDTRTLLALNKALSREDLPLLDLSPRARIRPDEVVLLRGGDKKRTRAVQAGLRRLGKHFAIEALSLTVDGDFGPNTEAAVQAFQHQAYLPATGVVDRSTLEALSAALTAVGLEDVKITAPSGGDAPGCELHFYPGPEELKVHVLRGGKLLKSFGMVGGKSDKRADPDNPKIDYSPTPEGIYGVVAIGPHSSHSWAYSYVPYGAPLRQAGDEVEFQDTTGQWQLASGPDGVFAKRKPEPLTATDYRDPNGELMSIWTKNDFGHLRARLRDLETQKLQSHMIHSGSATETTAAYFSETDSLTDPKQAALVLRYSHGCEHIHPKDFDELITRGWLKQGTRFVVHGYDETFDPENPPVPAEEQDVEENGPGTTLVRRGPAKP